MFNELHELQSKRFELEKMNSELLDRLRKGGGDLLLSKISNADVVLEDLGDLYGECIDIIEE